MSVLVENGHINEYPYNHARILYGNVATAATATGEVTNFPASAALNDFTYERWKPSTSGDSITVTFPAQNFNAIGLAAHSDLDPVVEVRTVNGVFETVTAYPFEGATLSSDFTESDYGILDYSPDNEAILFLIKPRQADAVRITVTYSGTAPTLGVIRVGNVLEMQRPFYQGHTPAMLAADSTLRPNISEGGEWLGASQVRQGRSLQFDWENLKAPWVRKNWVPFSQSLKTKPFIIAWNPKRFAADCFYASTSTVPKPTNSGPLNYQSISLSARGYSDGTDPEVENLAMATFDDLFTFTRSTTATYYDAGGVLQTAAIDEPRFTYDPDTLAAEGLLIEESRTQLLEYSQNLLQGIWNPVEVEIQPYAIVSPNGRLQAQKVIATSTNSFHTAQQAVTSTTGLVHGVFVKAFGVTRVGVGLAGGGAGTAGRDFDLSAGTSSAPSGDFTYTDAADYGIEQVSEGFYFCWIYGSSTYARVDIYLLDDSGNRTFTGNDEDGIIFWAAQVESGSFPTSYIPSTDSFTSRSTTATFYDSAGVLQTAAVDEARDDAHGWLNGVLYPIGLLLEDAATNLVLHNRDGTQAAWNAINAPTVARDATGIDGVANSATTVTDGGASFEYIEQEITVPDDTTEYTSSFFVEKQNGATVGLAQTFIGGTVDNGQYGFDLETGASSPRSTNSGNSTIAVTDAGGWWRVEITSSNNGTGNTTLQIQILPAIGSDLVNWDDTQTGFVVFDYAQTEADRYATSPIETAASTVTRAADVSSSAQTTRAADDCVRTLGEEFNAEAFTLYVEYDFKETDLNSNARLFTFNDGATDNRLALSATAVVSELNDGGAVFNGFADLSVTGKAALVYDGSNVSVYAEGAQKLSPTAVSIDPTLFTQVLLGARTSAPTPEIALKDLRLYPRALTQTELEELTA